MEGTIHATRPLPARRFGLSVLLLMALLLSGCGVNNIPSYDEAANAAWSQVLNQYQRRAELIPNLVETVKGYAKHEQDTLQAVVEARAKVSQMRVPDDILSNPAAFKQFQASQDALSGALSKLMVVVERYPDLKANQNFLALQNQLEGTENRIAVARRDYIEAVRRYNTELRTYPGKWWHSLLYSELQPKSNFTVSEQVTRLPSVKF